MAEDKQPTPEEISGHTDGEVLDSGEKVVFDFDEKGNFLGWHKEAA